MSTRALLYARVSYDDRKNEARNLEGQIEDGREYCQEKGHRIVAELAEDDRGASGASWDLPKLNEALDMARANEFDVLVVRELDRFARGLAKQLVIESEFKQHGVEIEYVLGEYPDTPEGNLNKNVKAVIAEYEREKINQRMTRGRRNVVRSGKLMLHGNHPPYGYRVEDRMLVIYEPEAKIVRLIFGWYVYGDGNERLSVRAIARRLTEMEVPTWADTKSDGGFGKLKQRERGHWSHSAVSDILNNEVYTGVWHYGKKRLPPDQWLALEVPAIVSREPWEAVGERRKRNQELAKRNGKHDYLMGRRVTCGHCGSRMSGKRASPWKGREYYYYYCPGAMGRLAGCTCDTKYFNSSQVDAAVWEWVRGILLHPETLREKLEERRDELKRKVKPLHDRVVVIDDLLAQNRRQLEKLLDRYLAENFPKEWLTERKARLETTIEALDLERTLSSIEGCQKIMTDRQIKTIEDMAAKMSRELEAANASFEARRRVVDSLDVTVTLAIEEDQKVAHVRCMIRPEDEALAIESTHLRTCGRPGAGWARPFPPGANASPPR